MVCNMCNSQVIHLWQL